MIQIETTKTELKLASHKVNFRFPKASYSCSQSSNCNSNANSYNIFLYLRNVTYYIRVKYNDYQLSFSLKTSYKKIAVRKLKEIELLINLLNQYNPELTEQEIKNQIKELINDELNCAVGLPDHNHEKLEAQYNAYDDYTTELRETIAKENLTIHKLDYLNAHLHAYEVIKSKLEGNP